MDVDHLSYNGTTNGVSGKRRRDCWPDDVGILAMELYFPDQCVEQSHLETFDGVSQVSVNLTNNQLN